MKKIFNKYSSYDVEGFDTLWRYEDFARFVKMCGILFVIGLIFIALVIFRW